MANFSNVTREALAGHSGGTLIGSVTAVREVLCGEKLGLSAPGVAQTLTRDTLAGQMSGSLVKSQTAVREVLQGQQVGLSIKPLLFSVVREVLVRDSSYKFRSATRDTLVSAPGAITTIAWAARTEHQLAAQYRETPDAATVRSYTPLYTLRQQVARAVQRAQPISMHSVLAERQLVAQAHPRIKTTSTSRMATLRQLVARSRDTVAIPQSGVFVLTDAQLAAQRRATVPVVDMRSPLQARTEAQLVAQSRYHGMQLLVWTNVQLVAIRRQTTAAQVVTDVQQVAQHRDAGPQVSPIDVPTVSQQGAQARMVPAETWSQTSVVTVQQQVAQRQVRTTPHSAESAMQLAQQVAQRRVPIIYPTMLYAATEAQLVAQVRVPAPLQYTGEEAGQYVQLAAQHRETAEPGAVSDWRVRSDHQLVAQHRPPADMRSPVDVATLQVQYAMAQPYPPPGEVIGPERGAQVKQQRALAAQRRVVLTPAELAASRTVYHAGQQPVVGAAYADPHLAASQLTVTSVTAAPVVGTAYLDPREAFSDAVAFGVLGAVAVGEVFPDPGLSFSDAMVQQLQSAPVLGAAYPDPRLATSDLTVTSAAAVAALGDASFPDPTIPVSEVRLQLAGAIPALGDTSFPDPRLPTSQLDVFALGAAVAIRDITLLSIPARTNRRRPVASVSIS